jgi:hypothetical protein
MLLDTITIIALFGSMFLTAWEIMQGRALK